MTVPDESKDLLVAKVENYSIKTTMWRYREQTEAVSTKWQSSNYGSVLTYHSESIAQSVVIFPIKILENGMGTEILICKSRHMWIIKNHWYIIKSLFGFTHSAILAIFIV